MGRRWGKTVLGEVLCVTFAARSAKVAWVVPSYKNGRPLWRMVRRTLAPLKAAGLVRINETDRIVEFSDAIGGGFLGMYTGEDNCDAMRGEDFDLVVVDEASRLSELAWTDSILPTLADRSGKALLISTPRGRNWFWRWWVRGQDHTQDEVRSFTAPSSANPNPQIQRAAFLAQTRVTDRAYRQEWLAEFLEDGGGVIRAARLLLDPLRGIEAAPLMGSARYALGLDLAKHRDYTVICVMNLDERRVVAMQRFNHESWPLVEARVALAALTWNNAQVWVDSTGVGDPVYDHLARLGLNVQPYKFTEPSRAALLEHLVLATERAFYHLPGKPINAAGEIDPLITILLSETEAMEYRQSSTGRLRADHPPDMHDDTVWALALSLWPLAVDGGQPHAMIEAIAAGSGERISFETLTRADVRRDLGHRL